MLTALNSKHVGIEGTTKLENIRAEVVEAAVHRHVREGFAPNYRMTEEELEILQSYFPRQLVLPEPNNRFFKDSSHPILASLNQWCDEDAIKVAAPYNKGLVVTIGDSVKGKLKAYHNCLLADNTRECYRIKSNAMPGTREELLYLGDVHKSRPSPLACLAGFENCTAQADLLVALHSLYDFRPCDLLQAMGKHGCRSLVNYMYIRWQLYDKSLKAADKKVFTFTELENGKIYFGMHDCTFGYTHALETWTDWATFTQIKGDTWTLVKETVHNHGPLHVMNCIVVATIPTVMLDGKPKYGETRRIMATVPVGATFHEYVKVPDIVVAARGGFRIKQSELEHIQVPAHVVSTILAYAQRCQDARYEFCEVATLASGLRSKLVIGAKTIFGFWEADAQSYHHAVVSLFIIGAIKRTERTKTISKCFKELKEYCEGSFSAFIGDLWTGFIRLFDKGPDCDKIVDSWHLWHYNVLEYQDLIISSILYSNGDWVSNRPAQTQHLLPPPDDGSSAYDDDTRLDSISVSGLDDDDADENPGTDLPDLDDAVSLPASRVGPSITAAVAVDANKAPNNTLANNSLAVDNGGVAGTAVAAKLAALDAHSRSAVPSMISGLDVVDMLYLDQNNNNKNLLKNGNKISLTAIVDAADRPAGAAMTSQANQNDTLNPAAIAKPSKLTDEEVAAVIKKLFGDEQTRVDVNQSTTPNIVPQSAASEPVGIVPIDTNAPKLIPFNAISDDDNNQTHLPNLFVRWVKGDITKAHCQVLVNAANQQLQLGSGVAGAFRNACGPQLQVLCDAIKGPIAVSKLAKTSAPNLSGVSCIYHAVGPRKSDYTDVAKFKKALDDVYDCILREALRSGIKNIGLPLMSAGVFGATTKESLEALAAAVLRVGGEILRSGLDVYLFTMDFSGSTPFSPDVSPTFKHRFVEFVYSDRTGYVPANKHFTGAVVRQPIVRTGTPKDLAKPVTGVTGTDYVVEVPLDVAPIKGAILKSPVSDAVRIDREKSGNYPARFLGGHCALQSFWEAAFEKAHKYPIAEFIKTAHKLLLRHSASGNAPVVSIADARDYIFNGNWQTVSCECVLQLLARHYQKGFTLLHVDRGTVVNKYLINVTQTTPSTFTLKLDRTAAHYTVMSIGGLGTVKFFKIYADMSELAAKHGIAIRSIAELSAAPGAFAKVVRDAGDAIMVAYYYKKGIAWDPANGPACAYDDVSFFHRATVARADLYFVDAADAFGSERIVDEFVDVLKRLMPLKPGSSCVIKTFGNPIKVWEFAQHFKHVETRQYNSDSTETYYFLYGITTSVVTPLYTLYDKYHQIDTTHSYRFAKQRLVKFANDFFVDMHKDKLPKVLDAIRSHKADHINGEFMAITGYASASKSTMANQRYPKAQWVVPTRELAANHARDKGINAVTMHVIFNQATIKSNVLIIDELSQFNVEYVALIKLVFKINVVVVGDVNQVGVMNYKGTTKYTEFTEVGVTTNMWDVYRVPADICQALNDRFGFHMRFNGTVETKSGLRLEPPVGKRGMLDKLQHIVFNNATALNLRQKGIKASTITCYQGSRTADVVFHIDSRAIDAKLISRPEYIYTAMTRATNQLVLSGVDKDAIIKYLMIGGTQIPVFEEYTNIKQRADILMDNIEIGNQFNLIKASDQPVVSLPVKQDVAISILSSIITPGANHDNAFSIVQDTAISNISSGILKTTIEQVLPPRAKDKGYQIECPQPLVKMQASNDPLATVMTLATRYSGQLKFIPKRDQEFMTTDLLEGLCKAIMPGRPDFKKLEYLLRPGPDDLKNHALDYIKSLQEKLSTNAGACVELQETFDFISRESLSFFNKKQAKFDASVGFNTSAKVGQGVAAYSKRINIMFSAYARYLLHRINEIATDGQRNVILAVYDSDAQLNDRYAAMVGDKVWSGWSNNDFSEWDSKFRSAFCKLTWRLLEMVGIDPDLNDYFLNKREQWVMVYNHKNGRTTLTGSERQFSGNPFTICENTICNMALCNAIFDYKGYKCAMYKGDDSSVMCDSCELTGRGKRIIEATGHKLKLHRHKCAEFAGFVGTPLGLFPDVVRYAAKFLGKMYRDREHFEEAQMSVCERTSVVKTQEQLVMGCHAIREFYPQLGHDEANLLFEFLKSSRSIKFRDLVPVEKFKLTPYMG